ncbi:hypothetical protein FE257_003902 [Aspergillus nanangensis]|uniref:NACHT domain-containing protein n=1 Tax=Aspergillus nanangensis TaxID=2582783 RepID=A0AAD4CRK0_ASPNN|nr:hypothetical protein FE257_003902 [Aspergillus nanangensis]
MSFGYSVGDFLVIIKLADSVRKRFTRAPDEFRDVSNGIKQLSNILRDIEDLGVEQELTDSQKTHLNGISQECYRTLSNLEQYLDKYHVLDEAVGRSHKSKRIWKRVTWDQAEIRTFQNTIESNLAAYDIFLTGINNNMTRNIQQTTHRIDQRQIIQERQELLTWITPIDHVAQQADIAKRRQPGTGQWLLDSGEFQNWINDGSSATFFCPGIPGAGKTMMTSNVIDYLENKYKSSTTSSNTVGIAYIFCTFQRREQQNLEDLLAGLLKQLVHQLNPIPGDLKLELDVLKASGKRPCVDNLLQLLNVAVREFSRSFIIIDALDECQASYQTATELLAKVFDIQTKPNIHVFATSRKIPEIVSKFQNRQTLEIWASEDDVRMYLTGHMSELPSFVSNNPDLQNQIVTAISGSIDGMFLLARLHHDSLKGKMTKKAVLSAIKKLPTGDAAYHHAYHEAMMRICAQGPDKECMAKNILAWICCARRPLSSYELKHSLSVEVGEHEIDEDNIPDMDSMLSICAGLVIRNQESDTVELVHYTTQEYFDCTWKDWFPRAHILTTVTCLTYLSFTAFSTGICRDHEAFEAKLVQYPLYSYSALNWGHHAREAEKMQDSLAELESTYKEFLTSSYHVSAALQALLYGTSGGTQEVDSQVIPEDFTGVHLTAYFGLESGTKMLLANNPEAANSRDTYRQTPLHLAAKNGHASVTRLLIQPGMDINAPDLDGETPLAKAGRNGDVATMKLLIEALPNIDTRDEGGRTPLYWASEQGNESAVRILLEHGANVNQGDSRRTTPLMKAASRGHYAVVELLVKFGADVNRTDDFRFAAINKAVENGNVDIIRLLIKEGADIESTNLFGFTPLMTALNRCLSAEVVDLLLEAGARFHAKDKEGRPLLPVVAGWGTKAGVLFLLEHGADVDSKDEYGETALLKVVRRGNIAMAALLLEHGAQVDCKDQDHMTPLSYAVQRDDIAMAALLLKHGADSSAGITQIAPNDCFQEVIRLLVKNGARLDYAQAPLLMAGELDDRNLHNIIHLVVESSMVSDFKQSEVNNLMLFTASRGITQAVELLLPKCKSLEMTDQDGNTPLLLASQGRHESVSQILIRHGANLEAKNNQCWTALSITASKPNDSLMKALLDAGANPNSQDNKGRTPVSYAASPESKFSISAPYEVFPENVRLVRMLLDAGAHDNIKDKEGRTPFSYAASSPSCLVLRAFLDRGVHSDTEDNMGRTPISHAAEKGRTAIVKLLLQYGASPNIKDIFGRTPLSWAAEKCNTGYKLISMQYPKWRHSRDYGKEVVDILVDASADPNLKDDQGQTPLLHTCEKNYGTSTITALLEKGADPNSRKKNGQNAFSLLLSNMFSGNQSGSSNLHWHTFRERQLATLTDLLDHGADLENRSELGRTPLMLAASAGSNAVVSLLLQRGADPETRDINGQTASMLASAAGHEEVAKWL